MTQEGPPLARIEVSSGAGWARLLPLVALVLALFLLREAWSERGPRILVHASEGHGLGAGDPLRFRGIEVGKVEAVELAEDASEVRIQVRLARSARELARSGTRFWIARPVLGVEGVSGLDTAIGAHYLALFPGPPGGAPQSDFVALEEPPLLAAEDPAALEVLLRADERSGLARGAPVLYRGIQIGSIVSVALAADATAVEVRARIHSQHAELVREDSRFYRSRAAGFSFGLGGFEFSLPSLQSLWLGGVALATPTHPGARARNGQRFPLADAASEEWLGWRPALAVGGSAGAPRDGPERQWGRLTWEPSGWFKGARSRGAWLVLLPDGVLGPADVLLVPEDAEEGSAFLELGGERISLSAEPLWRGDGLARRALPGASGLLPEVRPLAEPEDVLLLSDPALAPMAVSSEHLAARDSGWDVSSTLPLDERWHGALVLARRDGSWLGVLLVDEDGLRVMPLPAF